MRELYIWRGFLPLNHTLLRGRTQTIIRASWIGILGNLALAVLKIVTGFLAGSQAVIGDGIDSFSDVAAYLITLITAKITRRPPDQKFPYGYSRAETIATKALAFFIFFAGAQLLFYNAENLWLETSRETPSKVAIYVTALSAAGKMLLAWWQFRLGRKTGSPMLMANAKNMRADIVLSAAVLLGVGASVWLDMPRIDTLMALAVSLWILKIGYEIFMESNTELMEGVDDMSVYQTVFEAADAVAGVHNPHRARIRSMSNLYLIDLDIEVESDLTVSEAHGIGSRVEEEIKNRLDNVYDIMIHIEPRGNVESNEQYGLTKEDV